MLSKDSARYILGIILLFALAFMLNAALHDSAIMDELAHIPAGYSYVRYLDYRLNPEHPPLAKALAALPLLYLEPAFPQSSPAWTDAVNGQWDIGAQFLYASGNNAALMLDLVRILPIILTLFLISFVYFWSSQLLGRWWALLPAFILGFSPILLAHGHYVTTDVGAALGVVLATYFFLRAMRSAAYKDIVMAGVGLGIAELLKFSTVLLLPYFLFLILVFWFVRRRAVNASLPKLLKVYILSVLIAFIGVVYPVYALFTLHYPQERQVHDTLFILSSYGGGPTAAGAACKLSRCPADLDIWLARHSLTRPMAHYVLGVLMVLQRSSGGNTAYFWGRVSAAGSRLYFPAVYALKEPLPVLILIFLGLFLAVGNMARAVRWGYYRAAWRTWLENHFASFAMLSFVIMYWAYSIKSPLNIGVRHLMPVLPFTYMLTAASLKKWTENGLTAAGSHRLELLRNKFTASFKTAFIAAMLVWLSAETALAAPYFLSYFNELGGGTGGGYRFVTDSNYDWGQDLVRLRDFVAAHPEIDKIAVDYFGGGDIKYYFGNKAVGWQSSKGNPAEQGIHWLAVSVNTLQSAIQPLAAGQERDSRDEYGWLLRPAPAGLGEVPPPDYRAGTSIFIYHLQ